MSSTIIYVRKAFRVRAQDIGANDDQIMVLEQAGPSNCYEIASNGGNGRRTRSWALAHFGTAQQCMDSIIRSAAYTAGGMLKLRSACIDPATYIAGYRKILNDPSMEIYKDEYVLFKDGYLHVRLSDVHLHLQNRATAPITPFAQWGQLLEQAHIQQAILEGSMHRHARVLGPEVRT